MVRDLFSKAGLGTIAAFDTIESSGLGVLGKSAGWVVPDVLKSAGSVARTVAKAPPLLRFPEDDRLEKLEAQVAELSKRVELLENQLRKSEPTLTGRRVKRVELIQANRHEWPSIQKDLKNSGVNGLSKAAKTEKHGWWYEGRAREWARSWNKLTDDPVRHVRHAMWFGHG